MSTYIADLARPAGSLNSLAGVHRGDIWGCFYTNVSGTLNVYRSDVKRLRGIRVTYYTVVDVCIQTVCNVVDS